MRLEFVALAMAALLACFGACEAEGASTWENGKVERP